MKKYTIFSKSKLFTDKEAEEILNNPSPTTMKECKCHCHCTSKTNCQYGSERPNNCPHCRPSEEKEGKPAQEGDWFKDFDSKFGIGSMHVLSFYTYSSLRDFISKTLKQEREALREKVEKMLKDENTQLAEAEIELKVFPSVSYNKAISDILYLLESQEEKSR